MSEAGLQFLVIGPSPDLRYLTGFEGSMSERLTVLVVPALGRSSFVLPAFEAPRFTSFEAFAELVTWRETEDPFAALRRLIQISPELVVGVNDTQWSRFLLGYQHALPSARFEPASLVLGPLRQRKRPEEITALREVNRLADRAFDELVATPMTGLSERQLSRMLAEILLDVGNDAVGFATVASGPHSASPHHEMGERVIREGEALLFDFGGRHQGYFADVTRTVVVGSSPEGFEEVYRVVQAAQQAAVEAVRPGVAAGLIDRAARDVIKEAGYGHAFTHRVGHGVGLEVHEPPYLTGDSATVLEPGMTFSVEPGIYLPGRFGVRIEDTVLVTEGGGERLNTCTRDLLVVS
jgi:Xaa-Pro aminopeptidase